MGSVHLAVAQWCCAQERDAMSGLDLSCGSSLWAYGKTVALCGALWGFLPSASATESRKVLVLSVSEGGRQLESLRSEIGQLVQRAGGQLIESSELSSSDRSCEEPSCLRRIVDEQKVDLILAARIARHQRHERLVDMWIYDAGTSRDHAASDLCDARSLKECVGSIAGRLASPLLDGSAKPAASPSPTPSASALKPLPNASEPPKRVYVSRSLPGWRIGLGTMLGVIGVGALGTAIWAHSQNGEITDNSKGVPSRWNTVPLFASGYAVAGASVLGLSLSFFLPVSAHEERAR